MPPSEELKQAARAMVRDVAELAKAAGAEFRWRDEPEDMTSPPLYGELVFADQSLVTGVLVQGVFPDIAVWDAVTRGPGSIAEIIERNTYRPGAELHTGHHRPTLAKSSSVLDLIDPGTYPRSYDGQPRDRVLNVLGHLTRALDQARHLETDAGWNTGMEQPITAEQMMIARLVMELNDLRAYLGTWVFPVGFDINGPQAEELMRDPRWYEDREFLEELADELEQDGERRAGVLREIARRL